MHKWRLDTIEKKIYKFGNTWGNHPECTQINQEMKNIQGKLNDIDDKK